MMGVQTGWPMTAATEHSLDAEGSDGQLNKCEWLLRTPATQRRDMDQKVMLKVPAAMAESKFAQAA